MTPRLDGSILCLDAIHHDDAANVVDATLDVLLDIYANDANHDVDVGANLPLVLLLPIDDPILRDGI